MCIRHKYILSRKEGGLALCGLAGYYTKEDAVLDASQIEKRRLVFTSMLFSMQTRGTDATGIAAIGTEIEIAKQAIPAPQFIKGTAFKNALDKNPFAVIGHTRLGTRGKNIDANAHPFKKGHIVGAHNGVVTNWSSINDKVEVDSEVIFELFNKQTPKNAVKKLKGWFALTWIDTREKNKLSIARYKNEAFSLVYVPSFSTYFWCSLQLPMVYAVEAALGQVKHTFIEVAENTLYTIQPDLNISYKKVEFDSEIPSTPTPVYQVPLLGKGSYSVRDESAIQQAFKIGKANLKMALYDEKCSMCAAPYETIYGVWLDKEEILTMCSGCMAKLREYENCIWIPSNDLKVIQSIVSKSKN